jgi:hypothetical protein
MTTSTNPDGTHLYHVALGASPPEKAKAVLGPAGGSAAQGRALLNGSGVGTSPNPTIAVKIQLSGLTPAAFMLSRFSQACAERPLRRPAFFSARYSFRRHSH